MPNRLFGKIVTEQMEKMGLLQGDLFGEKNQGYVSSLQSGTRVPRSRKGIVNLVDALKFSCVTDKFIDWMWALAIFGEDPRDYFGGEIPNVPRHSSQTEHVYLSPATPTEQALMVYENGGYKGNGAVELAVGMPEREVLSMLGPPDSQVGTPLKIRWVYDRFSLQIDFINQKVSAFALK